MIEYIIMIPLVIAMAYGIYRTCTAFDNVKFEGEEGENND